MATPEPYPYRKLNYPINNLEQNFTQEQKLQTRSNIGIPSSSDEEGKVLMVDNAAGELVWADAPNGLPDIASGDEGKVLSVENGEPAWTDVDIPEQVNADWDATSGIAEILNKPNLATVATTGDYNDLSNLPSIPAAQVNSDWTSTSGVSEILHKPAMKQVVAGANVTITETADTFEISAPSFAQEPADWDATSGVSEILHKPDLSIYAETANLATVATTGDFDDLVNKPTIPQAQVNSDWNASSGVTAILNKPTLSTVATTGDYDDLVNRPSIPAAQVNADWNSSSGMSEILNKPSLAAVATSGDYSDLSNTPSISNVPAVTSSDDDKVLKASYSGGVGSYSWENETGTTYSAGTGIDIDQNNAISVENPLPSSTSADEGKVLKVDANGDPTWATGGGGGSQVNADWDATSGVAEILNKPVPKTLTAGANISISEGVGTLTISAAAGLPASTSADEGKCLVVDSNGDPEWGTGGKTYTGTDGVVVDNVNDTVGLEAPVDLVAGPGIVVDNPDGNTLRVSQSYPTDETVLFEDLTADGTVVASVVLSETSTNFEEIEITVGWKGGSTSVSAPGKIIFKCKPDGIYYGFGGLVGCDNSSHFVLGGIGTSGTTLALKNVIDLYSANLSSITPQSFNNILRVYKVVGIHRIANN